MNTTLFVAALAASISVIGWVVNYVFSMRLERRRSRLASQLAYTERQLAELYGPLAFLIHEGRSTFTNLLETLGRNYVFIDESISGDDLELWLFWVDFDFMPRNQTIQTLLSAKTHLIDGTDLTESYLTFLHHYNSWRIIHLRWKEQGVAYSWHSKINWPQEFETDVLEAFRKLKKRHAYLVGEVGSGRA